PRPTPTPFPYTPLFRSHPHDLRDSMSGHGSPEQQIPHRPDTRIAIVAGSWHQQVMDGLLDGALRACREGGITDPTIVRVPGSFEDRKSTRLNSSHVSIS